MKNRKLLLVVIVILLAVGITIISGLMSKKLIDKDDIANVVEDININDTNKIITEVNIVTNINNLTNPRIEEIAQNTFNEYFENIYGFEKSNIGPMPYLLSRLGLATETELDKLCLNVYSSIDYIKSNVKYEDFKNALLQYITEDYFVKYFSQYRNIDGFVAFCNCAGRTGLCSVEDTKLISRVGNTFNFKLTIKDLEMYEHYIKGEGDIKEKDCFYDMDVALEYVNNRLVISKLSNEIVLEGIYSLDNSDVSYEFYKDGTVEYSMNTSIYKGTYISNGSKELIINWEEETTLDVITAEEFVSEIEGTEIVTVINDTKIRVESEHDGEKVINEFIKK